jgi:hypothetical protein
MNSLFNFQFGDFAETSPIWFDWFSLIANAVISILSIFGGFWIATRIYSKEKRDKQVEETEIQKSEVRLFKDSLNQLETAINNQISSLKQYIERQDFSLEFNQGVHADFLHYIDIRYLYKDISVDRKDEIDRINKLLASLYTINDFRTSLRDELRSYIRKYNFHEEKFYSYRKLLYTKYFELSNQRGIEFALENGFKKWKFRNDDFFMIDYSENRIKIFDDNEVITENGLKDRAKLIERFIVPLIHISAKYMPEDYDAIEINDIANQINSAHTDMVHVTDTHFQAVRSYLSVLEDIKSKAGGYLK